MAHKCFISFKTEDIGYKNYIRDDMEVDMIDKSLNSPIDSDNEDYIMRRIREDYLSDSSVTISLIGSKSNESLGWQEQRYIKRELQASLYNGENNTKNGVLGVVLPSMYGSIFKGFNSCQTCGNNHCLIKIDDSTVIGEFSYNYYIPHSKCSWSEEDRYCVLVKWEEFEKNPNYYIDLAYEKRESQISKKTRVKP